MVVASFSSFKVNMHQTITLVNKNCTSSFKLHFDVLCTLIKVYILLFFPHLCARWSFLFQSGSKWKKIMTHSSLEKGRYLFMHRYPLHSTSLQESFPAHFATLAAIQPSALAKPNETFIFTCSNAVNTDPANSSLKPFNWQESITALFHVRSYLFVNLWGSCFFLWILWWS